MRRRRAMVVFVAAWRSRALVVSSVQQRIPQMSVRRYGSAAASAALSVRDSATGKEVEMKKRPLRWYACGPTVYDAAHLGHARTYVMLDMLRRVATAYGHEIEYAMGVTDVDDKIISRARELDVEPLELARVEEVKFFEDMGRLGCARPSRVLRVSEHVEDVIDYVRDIEAQGLAYQASGSVWFDVGKLGDLYGTFAEGRGTSAAAAGVGGKGKKDARDFALWKGSKVGEPSWESPWGPGRPGWHIECSAMTRAAFGDKLDLHAGGVDLAFPHHENEVAQWRGARPEPSRSGTWCSCWVHTGHLHIEGRKMSKSLKNFITVRELLASGCEPDDFRIFCALHGYRSTVSYGPEKLVEAKRVRADLEASLRAARDVLVRGEGRKRFGDREEALRAATTATRADVRAALLDDLDTPKAIALVTKLATRARQYALEGDVVEEPLEEAISCVATTLGTLGLADTIKVVATKNDAAAGFAKSSSDAAAAAAAALGALVDFRTGVRNAALKKKASPDDLRLEKEILRLCDAVRDGDTLKALGYAILDKPDGSAQLLAEVAAVAAEPSPREPNKAAAAAAADRFAAVKHVPPDELFKVAAEFEGKFSAFDEAGVPTHDGAGSELSKSMRKKLRKRLEAHSRKWQPLNDETTTTTTTTTTV
ncbi:hypothetical protein CTAYLR_006981 [Chrysophaeum taylorii]|uniref:cysteine--tRNA ligase n=1 Tax=Chrysophaeum taylorii TaxID=2483200 RepID=A0AAD7XJQ1_9STRA|nr:hypothetical protein CTAYLR_006981 [Chrysophaeum taylorii]